MMPKLNATADDLGASPIIDREIMNAIEEDLITSGTCFANSDHAGFERVKGLHRDYGNIIEIGCHYNVSSGPPLTELLKQLVSEKKDKTIFKWLGRLNFTNNQVAETKKSIDGITHTFKKIVTE